MDSQAKNTNSRPNSDSGTYIPASACEGSYWNQVLPVSVVRYLPILFQQKRFSNEIFLSQVYSISLPLSLCLGSQFRGITQRSLLHIFLSTEYCQEKSTPEQEAIYSRSWTE